MAFVTGVNSWERLQSWPSGCESGCTPTTTRLYFGADGQLSYQSPAARDGYDEYVSDPAKPVPIRVRPSQPMGYTPNLSWVRWLVDDQREFSGRTDVLTYSTDVLTTPTKVSGEPIANLIAATTGTDVDWVVKLIDVYPDEVPATLSWVATSCRWRWTSSAGATVRASARPRQSRRINLWPISSHYRRRTTSSWPGHKIMVQVQSAWFPLYDRNPQTFVPNILFAKPADYRKATERIYRATDKASFVELPVVAGDIAVEQEPRRGPEAGRRRPNASLAATNRTIRHLTRLL